MASSVSNTLRNTVGATPSGKTTELRASWDTLLARANQRSGTAQSSAQRADAFGEIFEASKGQHAFALLAGHSAKWMGSFLSVGDFALGVGRNILFHSLIPGRKWVDDFSKFSHRFQEAARQAFVDVDVAFSFTQAHAGSPDARKVFMENSRNPEVSGRLFDLLSELHLGKASGKALTASQQKELFDLSLSREQDIVDPLVQEAFRDLPSLFHPFIKKPIVRFDIFPMMSFVHIEDFSKREFRAKGATQAYELARNKATTDGEWMAMGQALRSAAPSAPVVATDAFED